MDKYSLLKGVAEELLADEGEFLATIDADRTDLPLEGYQRLIMGGKATPDLSLDAGGIKASLSINRVHYDLDVPWDIVSAIEGSSMAFYLRSKPQPKSSDDADGRDSSSVNHLRLVK